MRLGQDRQRQINTGPGRLGRDFGLYLNCGRPPPVSGSLCWYLRKSWPCHPLCHRGFWWETQHGSTQDSLSYFLVYVDADFPSRAGTVSLFTSVFPGPSTSLSIWQVLYVYQKSEWVGVWKWISSDPFSSSLILFLAMSHLLFNPSLEVFILTIMFSFLKYPYGPFPSFFVFKYFLVILCSVPNNSSISSSLGPISPGDWLLWLSLMADYFLVHLTVNCELTFVCSSSVL